MKLNKFALAISLMLPIAGVYAQQENLPKCKVEKNGSVWKVVGFKGHKSAGTMTYTSSNTGFAEVNLSTGELTAVAAGNTTITVTQSATKKAKGDKKSCSLTVVPATTLAWVNDQTTTYAENGIFEVAGASSASLGNITYTSSNPDVAQIMKAQNGRVQIKIKDGTLNPADGTNTPIVFTATQAASGAYGPMSATFRLTINPADNTIQVESGTGEIVMSSN